MSTKRLFSLDSKANIIALVALFLLALTPLVIYRPLFYYYTSTKIFFLFALVEIAVVTTVWMLASGRATRPRLKLVSLAILAFVATQLLSALLGIDPFTSFWSHPLRMTGVFLLLHLLLAFFSLAIVFQSISAWSIFFRLNLLVGMAVVFLYWFPLFPSLLLEANGGSTLGNSTLFGTYLLFLIGFGCMLFFDVGNRLAIRRLSLVGIFISLFTLFATDARAAQTAFLIACVVAVNLWLIRLRKHPRIGWCLLSIMVAGSLTIGVLTLIPNNPVRNTFVEAGGATRLILWDMAWQAIKERPALGWGPEQFSYVSLRYYNPCLGSVLCGEGKWADRAHNGILEILVGSGIIGLVTYLGVFIAAIYVLWKRRFSQPSAEKISIVIICLLIAYFIQNLTGFESVVSLWYWFAILAFVYARDQGLSQRETTFRTDASRKTRRLVPIISILFLPVGLWFFVVEPFIGFKSLSASVQAQTIEDRLDAYERAVTFSQAGIAYRRSWMAFETSARLWYANRDDITSDYAAVQAEINMAKAALLDTIQTTPNYLRAYLMLARIYQVEHRLISPKAIDDAKQILEEAIQKNPNHPLPRWALVSVLLEKNMAAQAQTLAQETFDLNPDDPQAHLARLVIAKFVSDETLVQTYLQESSTLFPKRSAEFQTIVEMNLVANYLYALSLFY